MSKYKSCPNCGEKLPEDASFCLHCFTKLIHIPPVTQSPPKKRFPIAFLILLLLLIVLGILCVIGPFFLSGGSVPGSSDFSDESVLSDNISSAVSLSDEETSDYSEAPSEAAPSDAQSSVNGSVGTSSVRPSGSSVPAGSSAPSPSKVSSPSSSNASSKESSVSSKEELSSSVSSEEASVVPLSSSADWTAADPAPTADFSYHISGSSVTLLKYNGYAADVVIPDSIEGLPVTVIDSNCFAGNTIVKRVRIPNTVTTVSYQAFYNCTALREVVLSNRLQKIGAYAFRNTALTGITLPDSLLDLCADSFYNSGISRITLPKNVSQFTNGLNTFSHIDVNGSNPHFYSSDGVLFARSSANQGQNLSDHTLLCYPANKRDISSYTVPSDTDLIYAQAFRGNTHLVKVDTGSKITMLLSSAFEGCTSLQTVVLRNNLTSVSDKVFKNCSSLQNVSIGDRCSYIHPSAFDNCPNVTLGVISGSYAEQWAKDYAVSYTIIA